MLPAEVSDLACQPPILICVGTFQPSCAASRGITPCMPTPHPNLCGYLVTIMCYQQRYQTLHADPPSKFVWVPSNHHLLPAGVSDLACQPPIQIGLCKFQAPSASDRGGKPCVQYRKHLRKAARLLDFRAKFPRTTSKRPPVPERRPTLHAISRALPQPWTTPKFPSTSRTWSTMGHRFWPN